MGIPKTIFSVWFGSKMPKWGRRNLETWTNKHSGWDLEIWDDDRMDEALNTLTKDELILFKELPPGVLQSTILRFSILRAFGGVYVDIDFPCLESFLQLIPERTTFGCGQRPGGEDECALLISQKNEQFLSWQIKKSFEFWIDLAPELKSRVERKSVVWPFNDFHKRVPCFFGNSDSPELLKEPRRGTWAILESGLLRICASRLHGGTGAFAHHQYRHTWWKETKYNGSKPFSHGPPRTLVLRCREFGDKGTEANLKTAMSAIGRRLHCRFYVSEQASNFGVKPDVILDFGDFGGGSQLGEHEERLLNAMQVKAKNIEVPWIFMPQSFWPMNNRISEYKSLFQSEVLYSVDIESIERVKAIDSAIDCRYSCEPYWAFQADRAIGMNIIQEFGWRLDGKPLVGISLVNRNSGLNDHMAKLKELIEDTKHLYKYIIIPQTSDAGEEEYLEEMSDFLAVQKLNRFANAEEWAGAIACLDLLICSHIHALISALSSGVLALSFGPCERSKQIAEEFGISDFSLETRDDWSGSIHDLLAAEQLRRTIPSIARKQRHTTEGFFDELATIITALPSNM